MTNSFIVLLALALTVTYSNAGWSWFDENIGNQLGEVVKEVTNEVKTTVQDNVIEVAKKAEEDYEKTVTD